jgi:hypothetical protein
MSGEIDRELVGNEKSPGLCGVQEACSSTALQRVLRTGTAGEGKTETAGLFFRKGEAEPTIR